MDFTHIHNSHSAVRLAVPKYQELFIEEIAVESKGYKKEHVQSGVIRFFLIQHDSDQMPSREPRALYIAFIYTL